MKPLEQVSAMPLGIVIWLAYRTGDDLVAWYAHFRLQVPPLDGACVIDWPRVDPDGAGAAAAYRLFERPSDGSFWGTDMPSKLFSAPFRWIGDLIGPTVRTGWNDVMCHNGPWLLVPIILSGIVGALAFEALHGVLRLFADGKAEP